MDVKKELEEMLDNVNIHLKDLNRNEIHVALLQVKADVLRGLQKYEE